VAESPRSPPESISSRATRPVNEIWPRVVWSWSSVRSSSSASSVSLGVRCSLPSSVEYAFSSARALARTERGTQSIERSSSRMFPLMRAMAYVSNLKPRSRSNFSMASMSPKMP
jgi:hypothetical protein